jgi:hypothetical protein
MNYTQLSIKSNLSKFVKRFLTTTPILSKIAYINNFNQLFIYAPKYYKVFSNEAICFNNGYDVSIDARFPNAHSVFFIKCDKNFVYNNLTTIKFPNLKNVYYDSHPSENTILYRHINYYHMINSDKQYNCIFHLTEDNYKIFNTKSNDHIAFVKQIKYEDIQKKLEEFDEEELQLNGFAKK